MTAPAVAPRIEAAYFRWDKAFEVIFYPVAGATAYKFWVDGVEVVNPDWYLLKTDANADGAYGDNQYGFYYSPTDYISHKIEIAAVTGDPTIPGNVGPKATIDAYAIDPATPNPPPPFPGHKPGNAPTLDHRYVYKDGIRIYFVGIDGMTSASQVIDHVTAWRVWINGVAVANPEIIRKNRNPNPRGLWELTVRTVDPASFTLEVAGENGYNGSATNVGPKLVLANMAIDPAAPVTPAPAIRQPTNLHVIQTGDTWVKIGWTSPTDADLTGFETWFRQSNPDNKARFGTVTRNVTETYITGLNTNSPYYVHVAAVYSDTTVKSDDIVFTTDLPKAAEKSDITIARKGNVVLYQDRIRGKEARFGLDDIGQYVNAGYGMATYFTTKRDCELTLVGVWMMLAWANTAGGALTLEFDLYEVQDLTYPGKVNPGALLYYMQTGYGFRNVPSPGERIVYGGFNHAQLKADKSYAVVVRQIVDKTIGVWTMLKTSIGNMIETEYVKGANITVSQLDPSNNPTHPNMVGLDTFTDFYYANRFVCTDLDDFQFTGPGWGTVAGQDADYRGTTWSVFSSNPTLLNDKSSFWLTITLEKPGIVWFSRSLNAALTADGEPGKSKLNFYINGVLKTTWSGGKIWQIIGDSYFLKPGTYTLKWEFVELDANYMSSAAVGTIAVEQFDVLPFDVTDYHPPKPLMKTTTHETLQGFNRYQRTGVQGSEIDFTVIIPSGNDYIDFISKYDYQYIFIDELGITYGGIFETDQPDIKKIGVNTFYYVMIKMKCNQKAGEGA